MASATPPTARQAASAAKKAAAVKAAANPLTGAPANQFTQVTNRQMPGQPGGSNVRAHVPDEGLQRRMTRDAKVHKDEGRSDAPLGYRKPEGMSDAHFGWMTGSHHMFPNDSAAAGAPAINQPHEASPDVTVQRRAEDLNGPEYRKGVSVLRQYGHGGRNPTDSLRETQQRNLNRVIGEHVAAGVNENSTQLFYGGRVTSHIHDPELAKVHEDSALGTQRRVAEGTDRIEAHPDVLGATLDKTAEQRRHIARNVLISNTADTSPNSKFKSNNAYPNMDQAEEAASAGLEGRKPDFVSGRPANNDKAAARSRDIVAQGTGDIQHYGDPAKSAKTVAFRGAFASPHSPDAYKVTDVMETAQSAPWLPKAKSYKYEHKDEAGNRVGQVHYQYPDMKENAIPEGATQVRKETDTGKPGPPDKGKNRGEDMVATGDGLVHALNDRATREVASRSGLSRSVNHADNVHALQAAPWGSEQMHDPMVSESHASIYPVTRNWAAEGHADLNEMGHKLFGGVTAGMAPHWSANPNHSYGERKTDTKAGGNSEAKKPYPIMGHEQLGAPDPHARPVRSVQTPVESPQAAPAAPTDDRENQWSMGDHMRAENHDRKARREARAARGVGAESRFQSYLAGAHSGTGS